MKAPAKKKNETRSEYVRRATLALYSKGLALPATRRAIAAVLGESADGTSLLGTVDPIYYRATGEDSPLLDSKGNPPNGSKALRAAARKRRDSGVRWEVLAGSIAATTGAPASVSDAKALYAKAGGTIESSYVGRGTRVGAPATYAADAPTPAEVATS